MMTMSKDKPHPPHDIPSHIPHTTNPSDSIDLLGAGRLLSLGRKRLIKWAKDGRLPGRREGFEWYFTRESLLQFAYKHCLDCGQQNITLEEHVYFCPHCASSFSPYSMEVELQLTSPMLQANQQLFLQRLQMKEVNDEEAVEKLCQRYELQRLSAYQRWYEFQYNKKGTHRVGLGDVNLEEFKPS